MGFKIQIRSRHGSHKNLRKEGFLPLLKVKSVVRFGSTTELKDVISNGGNRVELNSVQSIKNSSSKLLMKKCFSENDIKTANWIYTDNINEVIEKINFPVISKHIFGSRGTGNRKHDNKEELLEWITNRNIKNYIFEGYYPYSREYRLHVTKDGCFYACRKMLKNDTPKHQRWYRNDSNSVWILEDSDTGLFDKPLNWDNIVKESVKAMQSVGLDFSAVDVKVQSATDKEGNKRKNPEFVIIEINSAPSFGDITAQKYIQILPQLLIDKQNK